MYKVLALALATAGSAMPTLETRSSVAQPDKSSEFGLAMKVDGSYVSLNAVDNGTIGNKVLIGERLSVYPGTPAYFNGSKSDSDNRALNFVLDDGIYGIHLPEVGDNYGYAASAAAIFDYQEFEWNSYNGTVDHTRDAALNQFYACEDVDSAGEHNLFLKWGTSNVDGSAPTGCQETTVILNCNVEGGATDCSSI